MSDANELTPKARPATQAQQRREVEALIPHREPFLFVDAIVERSPEAIAVAWTVPPESDFFRGHYPGQPVTPGVILCEHCLQAGALLVAIAKGGFKPADGVPVLSKLTSARFRKMVLPGERVETRVSVTERIGPAWYMTARVRSDSGNVLRVEFVLTATGAIAAATGS